MSFWKPTDTLPVGKKSCLSLRELEKQIGYDLDSLSDPLGKNITVGELVERHSDIGVTLNTYTHLGLEDATDELRRMEDLENARKELK